MFAKHTMVAVMAIMAGLLCIRGWCGESTEDAADIVLRTRNTEMWSAWPLKYGEVLQRGMDQMSAGKYREALESFHMYFLLCPDDKESVATAIGYVKGALVAIDGDTGRAIAFETYASSDSAGQGKISRSADDGANPLADIGYGAFARDDNYFVAFDAELDARASVTNGWDRDWYKSEKAFERLNCGRFDDAARLLAEVMSSQVRLPHAPDEENWELKRVQQIIDRSTAGMGVVYRAKKGTVVGLAEFKQSCVEYVTYGPQGPDGVLGTPDDLVAPM